MKVILCGYHWAGCRALELLLEQGCEVYVYTHKAEKYIADLEGLCIKKGIGYTFDKIEKNNLPFIPDIICSVYYSYMIGQEVIDIVDGKIMNLFPALLPRYREFQSLTWAMINKEKEWGFTWHYIESGCGYGNILIQKAIPIEDFDTQLTLYHRVMFESMEYFLEALNMVDKGHVGKKQEDRVSYCKQGCSMDDEPAGDVTDEQRERFVRAMCYPSYPVAYYKAQEIKTFGDLQANALLNPYSNRGNRLVIFGCGGHARSIINTLHEQNQTIEVILIDDCAKQGESILGCQVAKTYIPNENDYHIIAIGDNDKRKEMYLKLEKNNDYHFISIIAVNANLGMNVKIGSGCFIAQGAYLGPQSIIGDNTIINTGAIIEHEVKIGSHTHIAPNTTICGRTIIGDHVFCGAGSIIKDKVSVCDNVVIGAGAVVKDSITEAGTYIGVPARKRL